MGEVLSLVELIRQVRESVPHTPIYISCSTLAGRELADAKFSNSVEGVFYAPLDLPFAVRRVLRLIRPSVLVVIETEIWPNLYYEAKRSGASVVVVNGRISDKAAPKYKKFRWFFTAVFARVDAILVQSAQDEQRFVAAGAAPDRVRVSGNLKYDFQAATGEGPELVVRLLRRPLWIAASTTGPMRIGDVDEDDEVLAAHAQLVKSWPGLQLLIAPRKPERFNEVAEKIKSAGFEFARRSEMHSATPIPSVILLDSIGELGFLFSHSDLVFMGGTLAERGGHNILEPALCSKPVIAGPHMENFAAIRDRFLAAQGYVPIASARQLVTAIHELLGDEGSRGSLGARAKALAECERGATARALGVIDRMRWNYVPQAMPWRPLWPILWVLSKVWIAGGRLKRSLTTTQSLATPVISVGGLAMGGVGKTPMVRYLADALRTSGDTPAVLTRGYRRQSNVAVCLRAGSNASVSLTGDEAQLLLRSCDVGIGKDRWEVGKEMEKSFLPSVFLLDDGFQHARLKRNVDIVLLDGIDPLAGDAVFPLGRMRESLTGLNRADVIVITRAGQRRFDGLLSRLPNRPIFFADVEVAKWHPARPPLDAVAAFCGLANPLTFFETLREAGARLLLTESFPDHHRFTSEELRELAGKARRAGASALVTTEKDFVNLPLEASEIVSPLALHHLEVCLTVRNEADFLRQIRTARKLVIRG